MLDSVHNYFGLSYANYLVLPRSVLQSMPTKWQNEFIKLIEELDETNWREELMPNDWYDYMVKARNNKKKFIKDPLCNYDRGRRYVFNK